MTAQEDRRSDLVVFLGDLIGHLVRALTHSVERGEPFECVLPR